MAIGTAIGALVLFIAFDHNPQGVFRDQATGAVHFPYSAGLFLVWALPSFVVALLVGWAPRLLARAIRQRM